MVIKELFPDYGTESCKNRNLLLSGMPSMGAEDCLDRLAGEALSEGSPVFYFNDHLSIRRRNWLLTQALERHYKIYEVNDRECRCPSMDLLSLFYTRTEKAEAIYSFLYNKDDSRDTVSGICRYLSDCICVLQERIGHFSVRDVLGMLVEDVKDGITRCRSLSDYEIDEECRFLESRFVYECYGKISDRAHALFDCGVIDAISGANDIMDACSGPVLFLISSPEEKRGSLNTSSYVFNGFLQVIRAVCAARNDRMQPYHVFVSNSCIFRREEFTSMMQVGMEGSIPLSVCVFDDSMTKVSNCHGLEIIDLYDAYGIFKCNTDARFWSDFVGTILSPEVTTTHSRRRGIVPVTIPGGVIAGPRGRYDGTSIRRVEKPLYEARYFSSLKEKEMLFYNAATNRKNKKRLYW